MHETSPRNAIRLVRAEPVNGLPVSASEQQRLLSALDGNAPLQQVLATISTPAGELLKTISKALGPAEAEIEFVEKITIRET